MTFMLLNKYNNSDIIYDLARIESTYQNNKREFFKYQNKKYYSLIKEYTYDGGHLNQYGRKLVAQELLKVLLKIAVSR